MSDAPTPPPPPASPPPPGYPPPPGGGGLRLPWEERDKHGFAGALIETIKLLATAPKDAFSRLRKDEDFVNPLIFGVLVYWVGHIVAAVWNVIFGQAIMQSVFSAMEGMEGMEGLDASMFLGGGASLIIDILIGPIYALFVIFIGAGILHLIAMLVGALENSEIGFEGTLKVVCYGMVANLANIVPVVGWIIAFIGSLILLTVGIAQVHKTTQGKALLVVLLPIVLCCVCAIAIGVIAGFGIAGMAASAGG